MVLVVPVFFGREPLVLQPFPVVDVFVHRLDVGVSCVEGAADLGVLPQSLVVLAEVQVASLPGPALVVLLVPLVSPLTVEPKQPALLCPHR